MELISIGKTTEFSHPSIDRNGRMSKRIGNDNAREIGQALYKTGGKPLMQQVYRQVEAETRSTTCSLP